MTKVTTGRETINLMRTTQSGLVMDAEQHPAINADTECFIQGDVLIEFSDSRSAFVLR